MPIIKCYKLTELLLRIYYGRTDTDKSQLLLCSYSYIYIIERNVHIVRGEFGPDKVGQKTLPDPVVIPIKEVNPRH